MIGESWGQPVRFPPTLLSLGDGDVHVRRATLRATPERLASLTGTLAPDERARAERYRFPRDRARSIISRGLLRVILARYLDREPAAITFRYNAFGKPALPDGFETDDLRFNVS